MDDKIDNEQSASNLWSTALTRSIVRDLKDQSNEDSTLRNTGLKRYGEFFEQNKKGKKKWPISKLINFEKCND